MSRPLPEPGVRRLFEALNAEPRWRRRRALTGTPVVAFATLSAILFLVVSARAEPEWNVAAQTAVCGVSRGGLWEKTAFCGALRADILFGRDRNQSFALGPYLKVGTTNFSDARFGGGLSLLVPAFAGDFPVVLSAGPQSRNGRDTRLALEAFFGLRSHNFHGAYAMASGVVIGGDRALGENAASTLYVGLQVDGLWIALPFVLGYEWLRGTPDPGD